MNYMKIRHYYNKIKSILGLSLSLAKAKFKLRNEGSYLGIFWYLLDPIVSFVILLILGGVLYQNKVEHYPAYLLLGLIMFNFFNVITSSSAGVIRENAGFIKSMNVNKESFIIASLLQFIFSHIFEMVIFIILMIYLKISLVGLLFYPFILGFLCLFILGVNFILATIGVYVIDLSNVWSIFTRLLWFATPVFYSFGNNNILAKFNRFNPLYYFISIARDIIVYGKIPNLIVVLALALFSLLILFFGLFIFEKYKNKFAEKI